MIYLGIDPGVSRIGWAVVKNQKSKIKNQKYELKALDYGCFDFAEKSHEKRLLAISEAVKKIIKKRKPDILSIEKIFFAKNAKTALAVSEARGVIILEAVRLGLKILEFTPLEVKMALTSYGRAEKKQVAYMTKLFLGISDIPGPDDVTDALAVALTAAAVGRHFGQD